MSEQKVAEPPLRWPAPVEGPVLVDSGPLLALFNAADHWHLPVRHWLETHPAVRLITTWPVLTEVCALLARRIHNQAALDFLLWIERGAVQVDIPTDTSLPAHRPAFRQPAPGPGRRLHRRSRRTARHSPHHQHRCRFRCIQRCTGKGAGQSAALKSDGSSLSASGSAARCQCYTQQTINVGLPFNAYPRRVEKRPLTEVQNASSVACKSQSFSARR